MSLMVSHSRIITDNSASCPLECQFNLSALSPFDAMKVMLEQVMYYEYLRMASTTTSLSEYRKSLGEMVMQLPTNLLGMPDNLQSLYQAGIQMVRYILEHGSAGSLSQIRPQDLFAIFNQPNMKEYIHREYTATMTETFLIQWISSNLGWYDQERFPDGVLYETALYIPSAKVERNYNPRLSSSENNDYRVVFYLEPKCMTSFDLAKTVPTGAPHTLSMTLGLFDMQELSPDDLLVLVASFSIDHDQYVMTHPSGRPVFRMADVCYDLVTGSSFATGTSAGLGHVADRGSFFQMIKAQLDLNRLKQLQDYGLFGELLSACNEQSDIVNYFIKPDTLITATEAYSFRMSEYAKFIPDKFDPRYVGMAAVDEETEDTATGDVLDDPSSEGSGELSASASSLGNEETSSAEKEKPQIDPKMMLLELKQPSETMSDYIYRDMISRRISSILKNPPANAMPNDLLMLKRWRSRWLYLASVSCLRDFLSRITIRLSDVA